ncbi:MAG TPA: hypothetical protein VG454_16645 [Gemmatimonadales bacterium]|nr:hypothetical protein [Gemmatimonadales bacterium]
MAFYIQLSFLRINRTRHLPLTVALGLLVVGACAEPSPAVSRVWPAMGTMLSAAAWSRDTNRLAAALDAAHDSVDRIDSLVAIHTRISALDSAQRDLVRRASVTTPAESLASGYALDRAALALVGLADSALLDLGGQYLWIGPGGRVTHRTVGIPDPENSLSALGWIDLRGGSIRTQAQSPGRQGRAKSVSVLAADALSARAWSIALFSVGCDSAFAVAASGEPRISIVCADSTGVHWTKDLEKRVRIPHPAVSGHGP